MAYIESLFVYPVKSCRGCSITQARLTPTGVEHDRHWVIVEPDGTFVTQRQLSRIALIETALTSEGLVLHAKDRAPLQVRWNQPCEPCTVTVWNDRISAFDQGDAAAEWLSSLLGRRLRLARFDPAGERVSDRTWTPDFPVLNQFSDDFQLLITSSSSLADLNGRLADPLPMNRFRPNIVIGGVPAYEEDYLHALVRGDLRLWIIKPAARCEVTMTDQQTAQVGVEPLRTLSTYRLDERIQGGVAFGVHAATVAGVGHTVHVGDKFDEVWNFD